jgi:uncharacterized protein YndB with AHSA1/START domain
MRVQREIVIDAAVERVWDLITRAEHIKTWYAFDGAKVDLRPGGEIEHFWREHGRFRGVIVEVVPPERFTYWYSNVPDAQAEPGKRTRVEFVLTSVPGGTLVRVTESGLEELTLSDEERQAYLEATSQGWAGGLAGLAEKAAA